MTEPTAAYWPSVEFAFRHHTGQNGAVRRRGVEASLYRDVVCFSAEADLVTGVLVTGVGIDTLRHASHRREATLAALPVVFGIHQLIEVPVWWGADNRFPADLAHGAAWLYLFVAFGVIPWLVPLGVRMLETRDTRRRSMTPFVWLGVGVAVALTVPIVIAPISAVRAHAHIAYSADLLLGGPITAVYVAATCGALLASSDRVVQVFGMVNLVAVALLALLLTSGVISLWCVWAAVTSVAIAVHLRRPGRLSGPLTAGTG